MFDIGFPELLIVSIVALLVLGPERLPEALRTMGLWLGRMRRSFSAVKVEIEREIGMDEVRRQLHNEAILEEMRALESDVGKIGDNLQADVADDDDITPEPHPHDKLDTKNLADSGPDNNDPKDDLDDKRES